MTRLVITASVLLALAACVGATPIPTISLIPANGTVGGEQGTVVGWGFTLSYSATADWVVLTGSVFTGSSTYGSYVDYLSLPTAPLYIAGPGYAAVDQAWDASTQSGVGEFDINSTALPGAEILTDNAANSCGASVLQRSAFSSHMERLHAASRLFITNPGSMNDLVISQRRELVQ